MIDTTKEYREASETRRKSPDDTRANDSRAGGQPPEKVEDRPNVSTVTPESYPIEERQAGNPASAPKH